MEQRKIRKMAKAGSLESNDILIMIAPGDGTIELDLESTVFKQYGEAIKEVILTTLTDEGVRNAKVKAQDKGALDYTIKARVKTCVMRGSSEYEL